MKCNWGNPYAEWRELKGRTMIGKRLMTPVTFHDDILNMHNFYHCDLLWINLKNGKNWKKLMISQKLSIVSIWDIHKSIPEVRFTIRSSHIKEIQGKNLTLVTSSGQTVDSNLKVLWDFFSPLDMPFPLIYNLIRLGMLRFEKNPCSFEHTPLK